MGIKNLTDELKRLKLLAEEEAVASVLKADQEVREGKLLAGDLRELSLKQRFTDIL